jgi:hypothetical protein
MRTITLLNVTAEQAKVLTALRQLEVAKHYRPGVETIAATAKLGKTRTRKTLAQLGAAAHRTSEHAPWPQLANAFGGRGGARHASYKLTPAGIRLADEIAEHERRGWSIWEDYETGRIEQARADEMLGEHARRAPGLAARTSTE